MSGRLGLEMMSPVPEGTPDRRGPYEKFPATATGPGLTPRTKGRIDLLLKDQQAQAIANATRVNNSQDEISNLRKKLAEAEAAAAELAERESLAREELQARIQKQNADLQAGLDALQSEMSAAGNDLRTLKQMLGDQINLEEQMRAASWSAKKDAQNAQQIADEKAEAWRAAQRRADEAKERAHQGQVRADTIKGHSDEAMQTFKEAQDETARLQAQVDNMQRIEELARTIHNLQSASLRGDEYAIEMVQQAAADLAAELRKRDEQNPAA